MRYLPIFLIAIFVLISSSSSLSAQVIGSDYVREGQEEQIQEQVLEDEGEVLGLEDTSLEVEEENIFETRGFEFFAILGGLIFVALLVYTIFEKKNKEEE